MRSRPNAPRPSRRIGDEAVDAHPGVQRGGDVNLLVPVPIVLPLFAAGLAVVFSRLRGVQRTISLVALGASLAVCVALLVGVEDNGGFLVAQAGDWPAPMGITLAIDRLSAIILVTSAVMLFGVLIYAIGHGGIERDQPGFHPAYLVLAAGVNASLITGDLFNLFVAFEIMLAASYVLITMGGTRKRVRSGMTYVVINLVASTFFIVTLAFVYSATGTVNMADLAQRIPQLPTGVQTMLALGLLVVFGTKAALFPLFAWLPDSYPAASIAVTAVFAGLLTKVGVYSIMRTQTLMFTEQVRPATLLLVVAALTMAIGVFGAIAQDDVKRILSFHIVSQIGYMIFAAALFTVIGMAAAIFYIVNHIVTKTSLLMVAGLTTRRGGSSRLGRLGGMIRTAPLLGVLFLLPALSLAGIPPFGGFVAKFSVIGAGVGSQAWIVVAVAAAVSLLTLYSMNKIWSSVFWGEPVDTPEHRPVPGGRLGGPVLMVAATASFVVLGLAIMVLARPLYDLSHRAAVDLLDPQRYIAAVLGGER